MAGELNHRERLLRTLQNKPVDRLPDFEFGAWSQTNERWSQEGLDLESCKGLSRPFYCLDRFFGTDDDDYGPALNLNVGLLPSFDEVVLEVRGRSEIIQDRDGAVSEQLKSEFGASIPRYIRYAIRNRADWDRLCAERLDPQHPERIPTHLVTLARRLKFADYPVIVRLGSLYGWIRNWVGLENLSLMLYDDRPLVDEMMEHLTRLALSVLEKVAGFGIVIDRADWWEDMCYNAGPLLSPGIFREMMVPRYQRITTFLQDEFHTYFNQLDCDGNIHALAPLWLEGGINMLWPLEVAATSSEDLFSQFGPRLKLRGGFDKRALAAGPAAIDAEFKRLSPLIEQKVLIPHTDHLVPPDVSFKNYLYYRRRKLEILGKPWREPGVQPRSGAIQTWLLLGPFDNAYNHGFHAVLAPENGGGGSFQGKNNLQLSWQPYTGKKASGYVDLKQEVSPEPWSVAYARCEIYSPMEREGLLELGSDDGIQVWINRALICKRDVYRLAVPMQDILPVRLKQGWNTILCKIGQAKGEWGFHFRLTDETGQPWNDIEVKI